MKTISNTTIENINKQLTSINIDAVASQYISGQLYKKDVTNLISYIYRGNNTYHIKTNKGTFSIKTHSLPLQDAEIKLLNI